MSSGGGVRSRRNFLAGKKENFGARAGGRTGDLSHPRRRLKPPDHESDIADIEFGALRTR
jgi:hypothetical protein